MPQLIAMIIIVVGAMIYMFQTFGGTGDKITGVAQKTSVITEINNIKSGLQFAARDGVILSAIDATATQGVDYALNLQDLAKMAYFADQINGQLADPNNKQPNVYNAISFGGGVITEANLIDSKGAMELSLVKVKDKTPGIFVDLSKGSLKDNAGFLENQLANDLKAIAFIDRGATSDTAGAVALTADDKKAIGEAFANKIPGKTATDADKNKDGKFIIYFGDFSSAESVKEKLN
ncbi:hypothetical protein [Aliarcobacter thereius]|uniref:Uncharacterized protein n=1 Tax=Aliarcobacter thereius LMG 24486 TaxID=1032240 RepID=A0A1C7WQL0_9BACT|nr:hypothetical protein [Aliarcobacter thereius]OCL95848.1 hypothetical protein AA347_01330 [Aliarcobacter thereius LMG 24486]QBF16179.1 hypothetical protein ATH_1121 [Aliarcobacter thereius LMG 24486]TLS92194.1 hypothetical protein FE244_07275 [Aliarcobacter thereius]